MFVNIFIWFSSLNKVEIKYEFIPSIVQMSKESGGNIDAEGNKIEFIFHLLKFNSLLIFIYYIFYYNI